MQSVDERRNKEAKGLPHGNATGPFSSNRKVCQKILCGFRKWGLQLERIWGNLKEVTGGLQRKEFI